MAVIDIKYGSYRHFVARWLRNVLADLTDNDANVKLFEDNQSV